MKECTDGGHRSAQASSSGGQGLAGASRAHGYSPHVRMQTRAPRFLTTSSQGVTVQQLQSSSSHFLKGLPCRARNVCNSHGFLVVRRYLFAGGLRVTVH